MLVVLAVIHRRYYMSFIHIPPEMEQLFNCSATTERNETANPFLNDDAKSRQ